VGNLVGQVREGLLQVAMYQTIQVSLLAGQFPSLEPSAEARAFHDGLAQRLPNRWGAPFCIGAESTTGHGF
jgi:hypothetical protein